MSNTDASWRRANNKDEKESRRSQRVAQKATAAMARELKCKVTAQYLPGEKSPYEDDANLDPNTWRVELEPIDAHGASWAITMRNKTFVVQDDPDGIMLTHGSEGLIDSVVVLKANFPNLRTTGEVYTDSQTSFGLNGRIDASEVHVARSFDLGEILNFSIG